MKDRDVHGRFIPGNKAAAYSFPEMVRYAEAYINHRANGRDRNSFGLNGCDHRTVDTWLETDPIDPKTAQVDLEQLAVLSTLRARARDAEARGYLMWETLAFNVAFGLEAEVQTPTKDDPTKVQSINPRHTDSRLIMFMLSAKNPSVYGQKVQVNANTNSNTNLDLNGSYICEIIGANGKPVHHSIAASNQVDSGTPDDSSDDSDFNDAMRAISETSS